MTHALHRISASRFLALSVVLAAGLLLRAPAAHAATASGGTLIYSSGGTLLNKSVDRRLKYSDMTEAEQCRRGLKRCKKESPKLSALKRQRELDLLGSTEIADPYAAIAERNEQRREDVKSIARSLLYFAKDRKSTLPMLTTRPTEICRDFSPDCRGLVNLPLLIPGYLEPFPEDPQLTDEAYGTKYAAYLDSTKKRVVVKAMAPEDNAEIIVSGEIGTLAIQDSTKLKRRFTQTTNRKTQSRIRLQAK